MSFRYDGPRKYAGSCAENLIFRPKHSCMYRSPDLMEPLLIRKYNAWLENDCRYVKDKNEKRLPLLVWITWIFLVNVVCSVFQFPDPLKGSRWRFPKFFSSITKSFKVFTLVLTSAFFTLDLFPHYSNFFFSFSIFTSKSKLEKIDRKC